MIEKWVVSTDPNDDSIAAQAAVLNNAGVPWVLISFHFHNPRISLLHPHPLKSSPLNSLTQIALKLYLLIIPGKFIDEPCTGASVPARCHQNMGSDQDEDYEVGVMSSREGFKTLIERLGVRWHGRIGRVSFTRF